jgi:hypothetical protein
LREAVLVHAGETLISWTAFEALPAFEQDAVIEFLKSLRCFHPAPNRWWWMKTVTGRPRMIGS